MLSIIEKGQALAKSQVFPKHMPGIDSALESNTLNIIIVNPL
jgi:hypothetical protein